MHPSPGTSERSFAVASLAWGHRCLDHTAAGGSAGREAARPRAVAVPCECAAVGTSAGTSVGTSAGADVGAAVGASLGVDVGAAAGAFVSADVGAAAGAPAGTAVGACVGVEDGAQWAQLWALLAALQPVLPWAQPPPRAPVSERTPARGTAQQREPDVVTVRGSWRD